MTEEKTFYTARLIGEDVYEIRDAAGTYQFLVVGEKKAALLDTGLGLGNLRNFVRTLTDKPLVVLVTHGHVDHAMGTGTFSGDAEVYMHPADRAIYREHADLKLRKAYLVSQRMFAGVQGPEPEAKDWYCPMDPEQIRPLYPGDTFDLGGETLEILGGEGHTHGSVTILLQKHRMLLLGDAINSGTFLFDTYCAPLSTLKQTLLHLREKTAGCYDRVLSSHGPTSEGDLSLIDGGIALCELILAGKDRRIPTRRMGRDCFLAKRYLEADDIGDHSAANILYSELTRK